MENGGVVVIEIREAGAKDLETVAELERMLTQDEMKFDAEKRVWDAKDNILYYTDEVIGQNKGVVYVAVDGQKVVGFCSGWPVDSSEHVYKAEGYLENLYVLEEYRRMGVGTKLAQRMFDWFRQQGLSRVCLSVYIGDSISYDFWKGMGFKEMTTRMRKVI